MSKEYSRTSNTEKIINGHYENNVIGSRKAKFVTSRLAKHPEQQVQKNKLARCSTYLIMEKGMKSQKKQLIALYIN